MTQTDGETHNIIGYKESILWKWVYDPKQSTNSVNPKLPRIFFTELEEKNS